MPFRDHDLREPRPCWCGESRWNVVFRTPRFGLARCQACGTYRTDPPPPIRGHEQSVEFYTRYYEEFHGSLEEPDPAPGRGSRFWNVAARYPPLALPVPDSTDIGCGEGGLCRELSSSGWTRVTGIDASLTRIERAKVRYPGMRFFSVPMEETGIPRLSQDLMVMDNVIEHLPEPLEFVTRLRDFLRPGGLLVLITPNMKSGQYRLLGRRWTPELAPHVHIYLFSPESLSALAERAGYAVVARGDFHIPDYTIGDLWKSFREGGMKGLLFSAVMHAAGLYARMIRSGAMLYLVAKPRD